MEVEIFAEIPNKNETLKYWCLEVKISRRIITNTLDEILFAILKSNSNLVACLEQFFGFTKTGDYEILSQNLKQRYWAFVDTINKISQNEYITQRIALFKPWKRANKMHLREYFEIMMEYSELSSAPPEYLYRILLTPGLDCRILTTDYILSFLQKIIDTQYYKNIDLRKVIWSRHSIKYHDDFVNIINTMTDEVVKSQTLAYLQKLYDKKIGPVMLFGMSVNVW